MVICMCIDKELAEFVWAEVGLRCDVYFMPDKSRMQNLIKISITAFCWLCLCLNRGHFHCTAICKCKTMMQLADSNKLLALYCIMQWHENTFSLQCFSFQIYGLHPAWGNVVQKIDSQLWDACEPETDILGEITSSWCLLPPPSHSPMLIMSALMQHRLVQRGILTQAQREIDFPHGFGRLWSQTPSCSGVCVWKPQQQAVMWKTGHAHNDSSAQMICRTPVWVEKS